MSSRLSCWLHGHDWGAWDERYWPHVFGVQALRVRWCRQCGARQERAA